MPKDKAYYEEMGEKEFFRRKEEEYKKEWHKRNIVEFAYNTPFGILIVCDPIGCCTTEDLEKIWISPENILSE